MQAPSLTAVFHVGPHPWTTPWTRVVVPPDLPQAAILHPGRTIDIHAYADAERPLCNPVMHDQSGKRAVPEALPRLLRYVDEELRPLLREQPQELERDFVAYIVAGYRTLFLDLDFAEQDLRSLQALRQKMITLAETTKENGGQGIASAAVRKRGIRAPVLGRRVEPGLSSAPARSRHRFLALAQRLACSVSGPILCKYWSQATDWHRSGKVIQRRQRPKSLGRRISPRRM